MKPIVSVRLTALFLGLVHSACNNYSLDDKIRTALISSSGTTGTFSVSNTSGGLWDGAKATYTLSNLIKFSATVTYNGSANGLILDTSTVPPFLVVSLDNSNGLLQVGINPSTLPNTMTASQLAAPMLVIKSNSGPSFALPVTLVLKRAFITSQADLSNFIGWTTSFIACLGQPTNIDKANCVCRNAAANGNLKNSTKFKAWLSNSVPSVNAMCNITNNANLNCGSVSPQDGGPWYTTLNARLASDMSTATGLLNATTPLQTTLDKDEFGNVGTFDAFTGTQGNGTIGAGNTCTDWTGAASMYYGNRTVTNSNLWTQTTTACGGQSRGFYCFETD